MSDISKMNWETIDRRVKDVQQRHSYPNKSMAFLSIVMEQKFPGIEEHLLELITDGADDRGVDGIYIREGEDVAEVFIFQSKYKDKFAGQDRQKTINQNEVLKILQFLKELFNQSTTLAKCGNLRLLENVKRIWELHASGKFCRYRVIFCSNAGGLSSTAQNLIETNFQDHEDVEFEFYGAPKIISAMSLEGRKSENGQLKVIGQEIFDRSDGDIKGAIASVEARSFVKLISNEDGSGVKGHLFDDNLRIYLGVKGGYNQSIIKTAASRDSYLFWYLNNGVTVTCKDFRYNKGHANPVLKFEEFQIVNGAQTSHSLVEVARVNPDALNNVVLMVRIYATNRTDVAERVAVATNSQARIHRRDIYSNKQILKDLETAFREHGYFFERKKNIHKGKPQEKRIDALKLGQIILAFYLDEPDKARTSSDSIFGDQVEQIFHNNHNVDELVKVFELFRIIESLRENYQNRSIESGHEHQCLIYGQWFVLFVCKLLLAEEAVVPEGDEAKEVVAEALHLVASTCHLEESFSYYQMFRSPKTRGRIEKYIYDKKNDAQLNLFEQTNKH